MAELSYFFDSSGTGVNFYTSTQVTDWLYQALARPAGVVGGLDNAMAITTTGALNSTYNTGVVVFQGHLYKNTASVALTHTAPTAGYRRIDSVVVRFDNSVLLNAKLTIIAGVEKNDGSQVAPAITAGTDILIATVLIDGTSANATTVTDARTFSDANVLLPTGTTTYLAGQIAQDTKIFATITGAATIDISAGALGQGKRVYIKNTAAAPQTLTLRLKSGGTGAGHDQTLLQNEFAQLLWDGTYWEIISGGFSTGRRTVLTSGTSYTVPAGVFGIWVTLIGGGGGGGGAGAGGTGGGGGGGGGGAVNKTYVPTLPGATITYAIGSAGSSGPGSSGIPTVGGNGGNTTFTGATTSNGGTGGGISASGVGGGGGGGGGGNNGWGGSGGSGSPETGSGGGTGGIGGGPGAAGGPGNSGSSTGTAGGPGVTYGGGGGGGGGSVTGTGGAGGAGAQGCIIVEY